MIFDLRVNGMAKPDKADPAALIFSWECDCETQFTVQMSSSPEFRDALMYLDTRNRYCAYDGFPLKSGKTYYWRVRSGVREWAGDEFATKDTL